MESEGTLLIDNTETPFSISMPLGKDEREAVTVILATATKDYISLIESLIGNEEIDSNGGEKLYVAKDGLEDAEVNTLSAYGDFFWNKQHEIFGKYVQQLEELDLTLPIEEQLNEIFAKNPLVFGGTTDLEQDVTFNEGSLNELGGLPISSEEVIQPRDDEDYIRQLKFSVRCNVIYKFCNKYLDYIESLGFEELAFETAFTREFEPHYDNRTKYNILVPVGNVEVSEKRHPLNPDIDIYDRDDNYHGVNEITIRKMTDADKAAIFTHHHPRNHLSFRRKMLNCSTVIDIEVFSTGLENVPDIPAIEVVQRIITAIYLHNVEFVKSNNIRTEYLYQTVPDWLEFRKGVDTVIGTTELPRGTGLSDEQEYADYQIDSEFIDFWDRHAPCIRFDEDWMLASALRRFTETYNKHYNSDRILDCIIACEGTLLNGVKSGGITSDLGLRASILLGDRMDLSRKEIRNMFRELYQLRSEIVHEDSTVDRFVENNEVSYLPSDPDLLLLQARNLVSEVILAYCDKYINLGYSVGKTNDSLVSAVHNTSFPE